MEGFQGNPGTSKLAAILSQRMQKENESPLVLDFGGIQANGSLVTNYLYRFRFQKEIIRFVGSLPLGLQAKS